MNILVFASAVVLATFLIGFLLMALVAKADAVVLENAAAIDQASKERQAINPAFTKGHEINPQADTRRQLEQARLIAAQRAAALPRGANLGIGRAGTTDAYKEKKTASKGVESDPITAVKIAQYHTWQGLTIDRKAAAVAAPAAASGSAKMVKRKLEPGKDYPVIEITDDMDPAERRKARIANAKAKSAAYKALKESGQMMVAETVAAPAAAPAEAPAAVPAAAAAIPEPDYIEISDDMAPDEKRKARIANSKAKSAYNKALKAAGIDPQAVAAGSAAPAAAQQAAPAAPAATPTPAAQSDGPDPAALASIPKPELIEITDDMPPEDVRSARIANSKAKSAYKKALKAAGIDPKSVEI